MSHYDKDHMQGVGDTTQATEVEHYSAHLRDEAGLWLLAGKFDTAEDAQQFGEDFLGREAARGTDVSGETVEVYRHLIEHVTFTLPKKKRGI